MSPIASTKPSALKSRWDCAKPGGGPHKLGPFAMLMQLSNALAIPSESLSVAVLVVVELTVVRVTLRWKPVAVGVLTGNLIERPRVPARVRLREAGVEGVLMPVTQLR